jgi:hypothetical protein
VKRWFSLSGEGYNENQRDDMANSQGIYSAIIEKIFFSKFRSGMKEVSFERQDIVKVANELGISSPKNLGDLVYSFRYRASLPKSIQSEVGEGEIWIIRPTGVAQYQFVLVPDIPLLPNENMIAIKVPDSTPGIVSKYAFNDEQALLAKVRYNRLVDIFLGITCYSLQNHLRTTVPNMGQVETDEVYVGLSKKGIHYVVPVQAKGGTDKLGIVQIEQDFGVCANRFPLLVCRPVAAQFMRDGTIALFEFAQSDQGIGIISEKHYKLVPHEEVTDSDLIDYSERRCDSEH